MFDSLISDTMSQEEPSYWDSQQRFDDDEAQACDADARLDSLSEACDE